MNVFDEESDRRGNLGMPEEEIAQPEMRFLFLGLRRSPVET
jgi:hypothetical protein